MKRNRILVKLTPKEFEKLLLLVCIGTYIKEAVDEMRGEDIKKTREIEDLLLKITIQKKLNHLAEEFMETVVPTDGFEEKYMQILEKFLEDDFWDRLVLYLGQRDFWRRLSEKEKEKVKKQKFLPDRIEEFYGKWEREFEKYGLERIEIKK
jgi:hypothetical protein